MTEFSRIETERLILRPFAEDDLDDFYEYAKNPNIGANAGWKPHESKEETKRILTMFIEEKEAIAIVNKENKKVIGSIGTHKDKTRNYEKAKMLGYVLSEPYWGKGLMTEAAKAVVDWVFEQSDTEVISVYHFSFNTRSKRVIEKCGFQYEGVLRKATSNYDGTVYDNVSYSLLKEEWAVGNRKG